MSAEQTLQAQAVRQLAIATDTVLGEMAHETNKLEARVASEQRMIERYSKRPSNPYNREYISRATETLKNLNIKIAELAEKMKPLEEIYMEHQWERYYFVPGGHVHDCYCSTWRSTTAVYWLTEHAGMPVAELIEKAGDRACTVCFPDAPVDKPTSLEVYTRDLEAKNARRVELEEKRAKAYAEAIKDENGEVAFKSMRAANTFAGRNIQNIVYFYAYVPQFIVNPYEGTKEDNTTPPEEHFARWDRSKEIAKLNREIIETIDLMELNNGEDAMEKAMKRFEKEVNANLKDGFLFPEDFNLDVFRNAGLVPSFKYPKK